MSAMRFSPLVRGLLFCTALAVASSAAQAQTRKFTFGYDQPHTTAYGIAGDMFNAKLMELSNGTMGIDQFPGAQLGQEPVMLQKIRTGDIDFIITSTANAASVAPQAGVFSRALYLPRQGSPGHVLADPAVTKEFQAMIDDSVKGAHVLGLMTMGLRNMYSKKPINSVADIKGQKIRVQATMTEDAHFPAYGAQTVHMPFGEVYTSLQTGVVQHRREWRQRLHGQQALRSGAGAVDDRARGQQQLHLGFRQDLEQPDAGTAGLGAGRRRRSLQERAGLGAQARGGLGCEAQDDGRHDQSRTSTNPAS